MFIRNKLKSKPKRQIIEDPSLKEPIYTKGSYCDAEQTIAAIKETLNIYGNKKYVDFTNLRPDELEKVRNVFPNYTIIDVTQNNGVPRYEMRPKFQ